MTAREMQIAFELEANLVDPTVKPTSYEIFYWLNKSVDTFVKTRWGGNNAKGESFEQTQKRIDDLRTLVKDWSANTTIVGATKPNTHLATLPSDYLYSLGEEVIISRTVNNVTVNTRGGITETTVDKYNDDVINPFGEHILHNNWARPLRLFKGNTIELISDGAYTVPVYYIRYIAKPTVIALPSTSCDLPEQAHYEVVKIATKMYLERIGSPRQQTYNNEIVTME
jgi:hypothetical protein